MLKHFLKWLGLRNNELGLVFVLGMILFANYTAMGITKVVAVSGFLSQVKDHYILLVWAVDMVFLILASVLQSFVIDRFDRIKLLLSVLCSFTFLYAVLPLTFLIKFFPSVAGYTFIYLLNDQQWRFFPIIFWILVADIFEPAQGKRLMPIIANFAFVGTIVGLGIAGADVYMKFGTVKLLYLNAAIFGFALLGGWLGLRNIKINNTSKQTITMKESLIESWDFISTIPAFSYLALSMLAAGSMMTILLYETLSDAELGLGNQFQNFYAFYSLSIAVSSIFVQSLARYLIKRIGLKNTFLLQPFIMTCGIIANIFMHGYWNSASTQGLARINYETVDLSTRKEFEALIPNERRGRVSIFIDSYLPSLGTILGSLISFTVISIGIWAGAAREQYTVVYLGIGIAIGAFAVYSAARIRATYDISMLNWQLKRRTKGASILDKFDFTEDQPD